MLLARITVAPILVAFSGASAHEPPGSYAEPDRPQFHFTPQKGWTNDPNGLCWFRGEYHMFFQHNPFGTQWGNMTWGHAVSKDLVHWTQLPEAIPPDADGGVWSGSAVVDAANTAGFGKAMVCFFTAAGGTTDASKGKEFTQCAAVSTDGRTFARYPGNPVLPHQVGQDRDPKVMWYAATKSWVMALYLDGSTYGLFGSKNLTAWRKLSEVSMPGAGECPDFFELPVRGGARGEKRWVFWSAPGLYRVGTFDGTTFAPETDCIPSNFGDTGYAAQTFSDEPKGRRIQISWLRGSEFPGDAWNQQMSVPNELTLRATAAGPRLAFTPVPELDRLRRGPLTPHEVNGLASFSDLSGRFDFDAQIVTGASGGFKLSVHGIELDYDAASGKLSSGGSTATVLPTGGALALRVLVDRASVEVYAGGGLAYMPLYKLVPGGPDSLSVELRGGAKLGRAACYDVASAWPE